MNRVAIVGGGVFGVTAAIELRRRGHDVAVIDPGPIPHPDASSTDTSKAVRMDYGPDAFYTDLAERAIAGWRSWNEAWGESVYRETGILLLTRGTWEPDGFERESYELLRRRGVPVERLDVSGLARRFPAFCGSPYRDGYFNPVGGWVHSARAMELLAAEAASDGVEIVRGRAAGWAGSDSRAKGVRLAAGGIVEADTVVVAAGARTSWLLPRARDLLAAIGQPVVHFAPADPEAFDGPGCPVWCGDIAETGWYGFPAGPSGTVKIGHHGPGRPVGSGDPLEVSPDERERAERFVETHLPRLAGARVASTRLCLYCDTRDGDFLIARVPETQGLVVAAGGSGHGFKFAPVLGAVIADVVEGKANPDADRFRWREPRSRTKEAARHG